MKPSDEAIEAVLAERDALKAERDALQLNNAHLTDELEALGACLRREAKYRSIAEEQAETAETERDALLDRLASEAMLEGARAAIEAMRPIIEAADKEDSFTLESNARLAPVEDEALLKMVDEIIYVRSVMIGTSTDEIAREVITHMRPHIEAAERERCAKKILEQNWVDADPEEIAATIRSGNE